MKQSLVPLLRSPGDGSPLTLEDAVLDGGEIVSGTLRAADGAGFPIVDGLPMLAPDMAEDPTFDFKWRLIGDSYGRAGATRVTREQWYLDRFGFGDRAGLLAFLGDKRLVLDAGTGSGVDAAMFAESGATVVAIDLSGRAAASTYRYLGHLPNVHVLQADLQRLPFAPETFDYISCDQVLHHTLDTARSFTALAGLLAPGAALAIYVYSKKAPIREFSDDYLRERLAHLPPEECYAVCEAITKLGRALSGLRAEVDVPEAIPVLGIAAGRQDVQRLIYWTVLKCFWNDDYDFTTNAVINFDWYHPRYAWRHSPEEVRGWYASHGLVLDRLDIIPSGISAVGRRG